MTLVRIFVDIIKHWDGSCSSVMNVCVMKLPVVLFLSHLGYHAGSSTI
jgi:hypothetical protein